MKRCSKCGQSKEIICFNKSKTFVDGYMNWCIDCMKIYRKEWRLKNSDKIKKRSKEYYIENKEKINKYHGMWAARTRDKRRDSINAINRKRYSKNYKVRLRQNIAVGIRKSLRGERKSKSTWNAVGYNIDQLKRHLEKQFTEGMSWENYGKWHIDHIVPVSVFNFKSVDDIDFKRCWSLNNLQPLWGKDNNFKRAKLYVPFQPIFPISI